MAAAGRNYNVHDFLHTILTEIRIRQVIRGYRGNNGVFNVTTQYAIASGNLFASLYVFCANIRKFRVHRVDSYSLHTDLPWENL